MALLFIGPWYSMFLANLALLCRVSIGDVRQTDDARERLVMGLYDNLDDKLFCTWRDPTQLATADTWFRTCRTSSFCTIAWQLA